MDDSNSNGIIQSWDVGHAHDRGESSSIPKEEAKCLRTLFFEGEISDMIFSDFKCLHILLLRVIKLKSFWVQIGSWSFEKS